MKLTEREKFGLMLENCVFDEISRIMLAKEKDADEVGEQVDIKIYQAWQDVRHMMSLSGNIDEVHREELTVNQLAQILFLTGGDVEITIKCSPRMKTIKTCLLGEDEIEEDHY